MENLGPSAIYLQIAEIREGLKTQQNKFSELHQKIIDLQSKISSFEQSLSASGSDARFEKLEEVIGVLTETHDTRLNTFDTMVKDTETTLKVMESKHNEKLKVLDTKVNDVERHGLDSRNKTIREFNEIQRHNHEKLSKLDSEVKDLERRMDNKRQRLNAVESRIRDVERCVDGSRRKLNCIDTKVSELERRGEEIRDNVMDWVRYLNRSVHDLLKHFLPSHRRRTREGILDF